MIITRIILCGTIKKSTAYSCLARCHRDTHVPTPESKKEALHSADARTEQLKGYCGKLLPYSLHLIKCNKTLNDLHSKWTSFPVQQSLFGWVTKSIPLFPWKRQQRMVRMTTFVPTENQLQTRSYVMKDKSLEKWHTTEQFSIGSTHVALTSLRLQRWAKYITRQPISLFRSPIFLGGLGGQIQVLQAILQYPYSRLSQRVVCSTLHNSNRRLRATTYFRFYWTVAVESRDLNDCGTESASNQWIWVQQKSLCIGKMISQW